MVLSQIKYVLTKSVAIWKAILTFIFHINHSYFLLNGFFPSMNESFDENNKKVWIFFCFCFQVKNT